MTQSLLSRSTNSLHPCGVLDSIDRVSFTECHLEWEDGREYWAEDPLEIARAIYYRRRVRGNTFQPFAVTCWYEGPGNDTHKLWEMEWTETDLRPSVKEVRDLLAQNVPETFIRAIFNNQATAHILSEIRKQDTIAFPNVGEVLNTYTKMKARA